MSQKKKTYHFVITVMCPSMNKMGTYASKFEWSGDRDGALQNRFHYACERLGSGIEKTYIAFWSFEPNDL